MQGDCLGAGGQVLFAGPVHNMLGMSSAQDTQLFLFVNHTRKPLPAAPPNVAYLIHGSIGDPICSIRPLFITAIRSDITNASCWSCVT